MSILLSSLTARVQRLIGDTDANNPRWGSSDITNALSDSLEDFNGDLRVGSQYEILGTGTARYYNPDPTAKNQNVICCYAGIMLLKMEKFKAAREAISYSNSAGSTNLTSIPDALDDAIADLQAKLDTFATSGGQSAIEDSMSVKEITTQG